MFLDYNKRIAASRSKTISNHIWDCISRSRRNSGTTYILSKDHNYVVLRSFKLRERTVYISQSANLFTHLGRRKCIKCRELFCSPVFTNKSCFYILKWWIHVPQQTTCQTVLNSLFGLDIHGRFHLCHVSCHHTLFVTLDWTTLDGYNMNKLTPRKIG